jgi:hypothetical protein
MYIGGADDDTNALGVDNGAKTLEFVVTGVESEPAGAPVFTAVGTGSSTALNTQAPRIEPETKDATETASIAL